MVFDKAIKDYIEKVYFVGETDKNGLYSVKEILEREKERFNIRKKFKKQIINSLKLECSLIDDVDFIGNYADVQSNNVYLLIGLSKPLEEQGVKKYIKVDIYNDNIVVDYPKEITCDAKKYIVDKGEILYAQLANFAIENSFNVHPNLITISDKFMVILLDSSFIVNLISSNKGIFTIKYDYDKNYDYYTNIYGLKRIFIDDNDINKFLRNLKIDSSNIPEYLTREKVLTKKFRA